jgi:hypothetical protein
LKSGSASSPAAKAKLQFATEARQEQKGNKPETKRNPVTTRSGVEKKQKDGRAHCEDAILSNWRATIAMTLRNRTPDTKTTGTNSDRGKCVCLWIAPIHRFPRWGCSISAIATIPSAPCRGIGLVRAAGKSREYWWWREGKDHVHNEVE